MLPCPVCLEELEERTTRKQKPYFVCDSCGVQLFVRFKPGIERLRNAGRRKLNLDDWVICRDCQVAVKTIKSKVAHMIIGKDGIYCPECGGLLLTASEVHG